MRRKKMLQNPEIRRDNIISLKKARRERQVKPEIPLALAVRKIRQMSDLELLVIIRTSRRKLRKAERQLELETQTRAPQRIVSLTEGRRQQKRETKIKQLKA